METIMMAAIETPSTVLQSTLLGAVSVTDTTTYTVNLDDTTRSAPGKLKRKAAVAPQQITVSKMISIKNELTNLLVKL